MLNWFEDYFTNRKQTVKVNNYMSTPLSKPLMFLIYINDLPLLDLQSKIILYADGMIINYSDSDWKNISKVLSNDLNKNFNWTLYNRLTINFTKSKFQLFGNKWKLNKLNCESTLQVGNERLDHVEN